MNEYGGALLAPDVLVGESAYLHLRVTGEAAVTIGAYAVFVDDGVSHTFNRERARIGAGALVGPARWPCSLSIGLASVNGTLNKRT